ncbi:MAG: hypothetical protein H8K04_08860 [Nitrospira sp.]
MRPTLVSIVVAAGLVWCGSQAFAHEGDLAKHSVHQYRTATVEKVESGLVFLGQPTGVGQRTVSVHKAERMGLLNPKKGDEVIMIIDEHDMLIDLHAKGVQPAGHRLITGRLTYADPTWEVIEITNAEGKHMLAMDEDASSKVFTMMGYELVVAELNEDNLVIDIHHLR